MPSRKNRRNNRHTNRRTNRHNNLHALKERDVKKAVEKVLKTAGLLGAPCVSSVFEVNPSSVTLGRFCSKLYML